ncbi:MAG: lipoyl(octanoyl) transferase LipB [Thermodesulfobacteriota bacterium]
MFKTFLIKLNDINYKDSLLIQEHLQNRLIQESFDIQYLLFVNYNQHIYTQGKYGNKSNLLIDKKIREKLNITLFETDRGGDITYHGPGQLVVYPIFNLKKMNYGVKKYVSDIEKVIKNLLYDMAVQPNTDENRTGVWVGGGKIASLGINIKKHITKHGFSININNDLSYFKYINTCGFKNMKVTSLKNELGKDINLDICYERLVLDMISIFNLDLIKSDAVEIADIPMKRAL